MMTLRIGIDLVDVRDVEEALARFGSDYLERVYTTREVASARGGTSASSLAAFFAAKEATLKALEAEHEGMGWKKIEVGTGHGRRASLSLSDEAADAARSAGITSFEVSVAGPHPRVGDSHCHRSN